MSLCLARAISRFIFSGADYNWHVWFAITVVPISLLANTPISWLANLCLQIAFTPVFINDVRRATKIFTKNLISN